MNDFPYSDGSTIIIYIKNIPYSAIAFLRRAPVVEAAWSNSSSENFSTKTLSYYDPYYAY